jgi:hypothetical protein
MRSRAKNGRAIVRCYKITFSLEGTPGNVIWTYESPNITVPVEDSVAQHAGLN